jgi:hypothetical protein
MEKAVHTKAEIVKNEKGIEIIASSTTYDRHGQIVNVEGISIDNFVQNPVMMFGHGWSDRFADFPVATFENVRIEGGKLIGTPKFIEGDEDSQKVKNAVEKGALRAVSIGFIPEEIEGNMITKSELLEVSFVAVPANPEALITLKSLGLDEATMKDRFKKMNKTFTKTDKTEDEEAKKPSKEELETTQDGDSEDEDTSEEDEISEKLFGLTKSEVEKRIQYYKENRPVLKRYRSTFSRLSKIYSIDTKSDEVEGLEDLLDAIELEKASQVGNDSGDKEETPPSEKFVTRKQALEIMNENFKSLMEEIAQK